MYVVIWVAPLLACDLQAGIRCCCSSTQLYVKYSPTMKNQETWKFAFCVFRRRAKQWIHLRCTQAQRTGCEQFLCQVDIQARRHYSASSTHDKDSTGTVRDQGHPCHSSTNVRCRSRGNTITLERLRNRSLGKVFGMIFSIFDAMCDKSKSMTFRDVYLKMLML
jgi:hypothetical protein